VQHACPASPQTTQVEDMPVCLWHACHGLQVGAELVPVSQQRSSVPPQAEHLAAPEGSSHTVLGAVHRLPEQQASPRPPHDPQAPAEQVPAIPPPQSVPAATQDDVPALESSTQQPSLAQ